MTTRTSQQELRVPSAPRMTRPQAMKTRSYIYGVEKLNGYDAWALFEACALGDVPKVKAQLAKDRRLVNAQFWYQFPIHLAVCAGNAEIVKLLLDQGADPGQSIYTYNSWDKLLLCAAERGHRSHSATPRLAQIPIPATGEGRRGMPALSREGRWGNGGGSVCRDRSARTSRQRRDPTVQILSPRFAKGE